MAFSLFVCVFAFVDTTLDEEFDCAVLEEVVDPVPVTDFAVLLYVPAVAIAFAIVFALIHTIIIGCFDCAAYELIILPHPVPKIL